MTHFLNVAQNHGSPLVVESIADQIANAAAAYLNGSQVQVPASNLGERTSICWTIVATKTAAGVAAPSITVRVGKLGTVADAARLTFNLPAQTAVVDTAIFELSVLLRAGGKNAVLFGALDVDHNGGVTGFSTSVSPVASAVSAAFDLSADDNIIGVSVNPGDAVWTVQMVRAEVELT